MDFLGYMPLILVAYIWERKGWGACKQRGYDSVWFLPWKALILPLSTNNWHMLLTYQHRGGFWKAAAMWWMQLPVSCSGLAIQWAIQQNILQCASHAYLWGFLTPEHWIGENSRKYKTWTVVRATCVRIDMENIQHPTPRRLHRPTHLHRALLQNKTVSLVPQLTCLILWLLGLPQSNK